MAKPLGSQKTGGRQKGTPNKKTLCFEDSLAKHNIDVVEQIAQVLPELSTDRRADVLLNLMAYLFPKRKAVEMTSNIDSNVQISAEPILSEKETAERIKKSKAEALDLARKLIMLEETPEECYIRCKVEQELREAKSKIK